MKPNDIVRVTDGSWCMYYDGDDGDFRTVGGNELSGRKWRVLAAGIAGPYEGEGIHDGKPNDLMLCEVGHTEIVLFTQSRFCIRDERPRHNAEHDGVVSLKIPKGTKTLSLDFV